MAMHDVDPNTTNRLEPSPQASDQNPTRSSDGTTAITNKQDGSSGAYVSTKDATVKVNDGTVNRVALGLLPDGTYGMKVSQEDVDVSTATDDQLVFNSSYNVFKIIGTGTTSLSATAGNIVTTSVAHGQSFRPIVTCYADVAAVNGYVAGSYQLPRYVMYVTSDVPGLYVVGLAIEYVVDNSNITFYISNRTAGTVTCTFKYYLLQESAS